MIEVLSEFNVDFDLGTKLEGVTVVSQLQLQKRHTPFLAADDCVATIRPRRLYSRNSGSKRGSDYLRLQRKKILLTLAGQLTKCCVHFFR